MKYNVTTIKEYLEVIPLDRKEIVSKLISITKEYFPAIEGNMQYNLPTFEPVCAIASQKNYVSYYLYRVDLVEKYRNDLGNMKVGKSCIRFAKIEQLPEKTIRSILEEILTKE